MDSSEYEFQQKYIEFARTIASEIRTPLGNIKGYSDLLLADQFGPLNAQQEQSITIINKHANLLLDSLWNFVQLAKIESNILLNEQEPVDLVSTLYQSIEHNEAKLATKNQVAIIEILSTVTNVKARSTEVYEIVAELIDNVHKYSSDGAHIEISVSQKEKVIQTEIKSESYIKDESERNYFPAYGKFGIIKQYVEQFGGEFSEEIEEGKCSTVWFTLPIADNPTE